MTGFTCRGCEKSDRLYEDSHGVFCGRCGPSVGVKNSAFKIIWYAGLTVDQEGKITHYGPDGAGGLRKKI
jgi:hypothetical protein